MSIRRITTKIVCAVSVIVGLVFANADNYKSETGNSLRFSQEVIELIANVEGCRRDPYTCPAGLLTQGIGHTGGVTGFIKSATNEQIAHWFSLDLMNAQNCIERYVESKIGKLSQGVFDAIGSFVFNIGCGKFRGSTLFKLLIGGETVKACYQLPKWIYGGGVILAGLVDRRNKELTMCIRGAK